MSTKSTIFLTEDHDEHCFTDCNNPRQDVYGNYIGDDLFIEIDTRSISYRGIDDKYIILGIKAGTEIHAILCAARKIDKP